MAEIITIVLFILCAIFSCIGLIYLAELDGYLRKSHPDVWKGLNVSKVLGLSTKDLPYFSGKYTRFLKFAFSKNSLDDKTINKLSLKKPLKNLLYREKTLKARYVVYPFCPKINLMRSK